MEKGAETDEVPGQSELPADNALIVLPPNARETANVEWLTVPPPPAGPEGAAQGLADHPAALYLARLAPSSRQTIRCVLGGVAQTLSAGRHTLWSLPWHQVRYPQMSALRAHLAATYAPATANLYMTAVRGVLAECWQLGLLSAEEKARACNLPSIRGERLPAGRAVAVGELRALLRACAEDRDPNAHRDAALVGILYGSGLRRAEASALDLSDLDLRAGQPGSPARQGEQGAAGVPGLGRGGAAGSLAGGPGRRGRSPLCASAQVRQAGAAATGPVVGAVRFAEAGAGSGDQGLFAARSAPHFCGRSAGGGCGHLDGAEDGGACERSDDGALRSAGRAGQEEGVRAAPYPGRIITRLKRILPLMA